MGRHDFGHSQEAYAKVVAWTQHHVGDAATAKVLFGFEGTNDYWRWLAHYLHDEGQAYRMVNPFAVKKHREATQLDYAKDDWRDAQTISHLLRNGQFSETQLLDGLARELREVERTHWRLSQELGRAKTLLRQRVELLFPEMSDHFKTLTGQTAQALLRSQIAPEELANCAWAEVEAAVREQFGGQRLSVSKVRKVHAQAQTSIGLPLGATGQLLVTQQLDQIALLQKQLDQLEAVLLDGFAQHPAAEPLQSIGIGPVNLALIVAEIGDFAHFSRADQLVKLAGTQPTPSQSGEYTRQRTPMSHKGRPRLRTYLFWACLRLVQSDAAFAKRHQLQCQRMHKLQSIGALMNRLLRLLWAIQRTKQPYQVVLPA